MPVVWHSTWERVTFLISASSSGDCRSNRKKTWTGLRLPINHNRVRLYYSTTYLDCRYSTLSLCFKIKHHLSVPNGLAIVSKWPHTYLRKSCKRVKSPHRYWSSPFLRRFHRRNGLHTWVCRRPLSSDSWTSHQRAHRRPLAPEYRRWTAQYHRGGWR